MGAYLNPEVFKFQHKVLPKRLPPRLPLFYCDFEHQSDLELLKRIGKFYSGTTTTADGHPDSWTWENGYLKHVMPVDRTHEALIIPVNVPNIKMRLKWNLGTLEDIEELGLNARYKDQGNRYYLRFIYYSARDRVQYEMVKTVGGTETIIATWAFTPSADTWYEMEFIVMGDRLIGKHNGEVIIDVTDTDLTEGYFGLHSAYSLNVSHYYDEWEVHRI